LRSKNFRSFTAWLAGIPLSYYSLGFFSNFYSTQIEIILLTLIFHCGVSIFFYHLLGRGQRQLQRNTVDFGLTTALFIVLSFFVAGMFKMAEQFTSLFDASYFQLENNQLIYFVAAIIPTLPLSIWLLSLARQKGLKQTLLFKFIKRIYPVYLLHYFSF